MIATWKQSIDYPLCRTSPNLSFHFLTLSELFSYPIFSSLLIIILYICRHSIYWLRLVLFGSLIDCLLFDFVCQYTSSCLASSTTTNSLSWMALLPVLVWCLICGWFVFNLDFYKILLLSLCIFFVFNLYHQFSICAIFSWLWGLFFFVLPLIASYSACLPCRCKLSRFSRLLSTVRRSNFFDNLVLLFFVD